MVNRNVSTVQVHSVGEAPRLQPMDSARSNATTRNAQKWRLVVRNPTLGDLHARRYSLRRAEVEWGSREDRQGSSAFTAPRSGHGPLSADVTLLGNGPRRTAVVRGSHQRSPKHCLRGSPPTPPADQVHLRQVWSTCWWMLEWYPMVASAQ